MEFAYHRVQFYGHCTAISVGDIRVMSKNGNDAQDWAWCEKCKCWYPTPNEDSSHNH